MHFLQKYAFCLAVFGLVACELPVDAGPLDWTSGEKLPLVLARGNFVILRYPAKLTATLVRPKAIVLFGSGCGGWSYWEENVCHELQADGDEVLGIDFALYSQSDFDLNTLEQDYQTIVDYGEKPYGTQTVPVILGGWSTGAEQAVAVAGGPHSPTGSIGLLLVSPGREGGYGSYATSYLDLDAPASKLFNLVDFAPKLTGLRIAQWHAEFDLLDSCAWLSALKGVHKEYDFPDAIHDYHGACPAFLSELSSSVSWILDDKSTVSSSGKTPVSHGI
jgi:phosphatidylglycerol lysyltransferase